MLTRKLPCPSCGVGLKIAEELPAGRKITCPKCGSGFPVPEGNGQASPPEEVVVRVRKPAPPEEDEERNEEENAEIEERPVVRKRRRPLPPDDDDEPHGEDEDRPLPRKRPKFKKKKPPSRMPLFLGLLIGGVLLLGAAGVTLAVVFWPKENKSTSAAQSNPPNRPSRMAGGAPGQVEPGGDKSSSGGSESTQPEPAGEGSDQYAAGKQVFQKNCARCHRIGGGSGMRGRGPDLSTIGRNHDADWLMAYIRNSKAQKPDSRMPSFEGKISDEEIRTVAVYLASLK